jgi:multiple sugar transport system permease protein
MLVLTIVIPGAFILALSFTAATFGRPTSFVGLANYSRVLSDPQFWRSLGNTVVIVLVVVHLEMVLGLGVALLFASGLPMRRTLLAIVLAPYAVSEVSAAIVWRYLFDPDLGPVSMGLRALGLQPLEWSIDPTHGLILVGTLSIWLHLPFTFLVLYAARLAVPKELYEAAKVDGAARWATFRHITWPILRPAMLIAMLFRYIIVFRLFSEVWLLTQGGPARTTEVLAVYLYLEAFRFNSFGVAAATGWIMLIVSLILGAGYVWLVRREMVGDAR